MSELCCANRYQSGKALLPQQHAAVLKFICFWERKLLYGFTHVTGLLLMNLYRFFSNLIYLCAWVGVLAALHWPPAPAAPGSERGPAIFTGAVILLSPVMGGSGITHLAADVLQM